MSSFEGLRQQEKQKSVCFCSLQECNISYGITILFVQLLGVGGGKKKQIKKMRMLVSAKYDRFVVGAQYIYKTVSS